MKFSLILAALLIASTAFLQAQTRQQNQERLLNFLTIDLQLTPDQVSQTRELIKQADNTMSQSETQYFSAPDRLPRIRKQILMDLGKKVGALLTPAQQAQYPRTKQKLYNYLQTRYAAGINKEKQQEAEPHEMQPAETKERQ